MDIFSILDRLAPGNLSKVTLDGERCFHTVFRYSSCTACFEICPVGAIRPGKPPVLNDEQCAACQACLSSCPAGAYWSEDPVPALLDCCSRLKTGGIELICDKHPQSQLGPEITYTALQLHGCLAGLGPGVFLLLAAFRCERVLLRTDACKECAWGSLQTQIELKVSQAQQYLAAWEKTDFISCSDRQDRLGKRPLWAADRPPLSRRDLFHLASQEGTAAIRRILAGQPETPGHTLPQDRKRVLNAVTRLDASHARQVPSLAGLGYAKISISEACTACGICARVCPTQALALEKQEKDKYRLLFRPDACLACEACYSVCTPKAITIDHGPTFNEIFGQPGRLVIQAGEFVRCEGCDILFSGPPGHRFCPACEINKHAA